MPEGSAGEARVEVAPRRRHRDRPHRGHQPGGEEVCTFNRTILIAKSGYNVEEKAKVLMGTRTQDNDQRPSSRRWGAGSKRSCAPRRRSTTRLMNTDEIVEQMKELGLFGATIGEEYGGLGLSAWTYAQIVVKVASTWMAPSGSSTRTSLWPPRSSAGAPSTEARIAAEDGHGRVPRQPRADRAQCGLRPAGDPHRGPARRRRVRRQRRQDLDHQQHAWPRHPAAREDRPEASRATRA